ncbi:dockerin type I domain-containing protein [Crateriforma spongiae]|uniref:dockerin type I domain-containing protein n=1 Tax=Crateriforma spongiae TaxID=2724528 RepID=UPI00144666AD|nr:dockerin type I domain-containing protein [Crateriforma spongiae]
MDVSNDLKISALDALQIINHLNSESSSNGSGAGTSDRYLDVSGDQKASALDALLVINALNAPVPQATFRLLNDTQTDGDTDRDQRTFDLGFEGRLNFATERSLYLGVQGPAEMQWFDVSIHIDETGYFHLTDRQIREILGDALNRGAFQIFFGVDQAMAPGVRDMDLEVLPAPPVTTVHVRQSAEDEQVAINFLDLVYDGDNDPDDLIVTVLEDPVHGSLDFIQGEYFYTPAPNFFGTEIIAYEVHDGEQSSGRKELTLNLAPVNDAPQIEIESVISASILDETIVLPFEAFDVEGDSVELLGFATMANPLKAIDDEYRLNYAGSDYFNMIGLDEKWLFSDSGNAFFVMPNGDLVQWRDDYKTTGEIRSQVARLDETIYENPYLLAYAEAEIPAPVTVNVESDQVEVVLDEPLHGEIFVYLSAFDESDDSLARIAIDIVDDRAPDDGRLALVQRWKQMASDLRHDQIPGLIDTMTAHLSSFDEATQADLIDTIGQLRQSYKQTNDEIESAYNWEKETLREAFHDRAKFEWVQRELARLRSEFEQYWDASKNDFASDQADSNLRKLPPIWVHQTDFDQPIQVVQGDTLRIPFRAIHPIGDKIPLYHFPDDLFPGDQAPAFQGRSISEYPTLKVNPQTGWFEWRTTESDSGQHQFAVVAASPADPPDPGDNEYPLPGEDTYTLTSRIDFTVEVIQVKPTLERIEINVPAISDSGADPIRLRSVGASHPSVVVEQIDFFQDANGDGVFDESVDYSLGRSTKNSLTFGSFSGVPHAVPGDSEATFFARPVYFADNAILYGDAVGVTVPVIATAKLQTQLLKSADQETSLGSTTDLSLPFDAENYAYYGDQAAVVEVEFDSGLYLSRISQVDASGQGKTVGERVHLGDYRPSRVHAAADADGNVLILMAFDGSHENPPGGEEANSLYLLRIGPDNTPLDEHPTRLVISDTDALVATLALNNSGKGVIAWRHAFVPSEGVRVQSISDTGESLGTAVHLDFPSGYPGPNAWHSIGINEAGDYRVAWYHEERTYLAMGKVDDDASVFVRPLDAVIDDVAHMDINEAGWTVAGSVRSLVVIDPLGRVMGTPVELSQSNDLSYDTRSVKFVGETEVQTVGWRQRDSVRTAVGNGATLQLQPGLKIDDFEIESGLALEAGGAIDIKVSVSNEGDLQSEPFTTAFFLSHEDDISLASRLLGTVDFGEALQPGEAAELGIQLSLPTENDPFWNRGTTQLRLIAQVTAAGQQEQITLPFVKTPVPKLTNLLGVHEWKGSTDADGQGQVHDLRLAEPGLVIFEPMGIAESIHDDLRVEIRDHNGRAIREVEISEYDLYMQSAYLPAGEYTITVIADSNQSGDYGIQVIEASQVPTIELDRPIQGFLPDDTQSRIYRFVAPDDGLVRGEILPDSEEDAVEEIHLFDAYGNFAADFSHPNAIHTLEPGAEYLLRIRSEPKPEPTRDNVYFNVQLHAAVRHDPVAISIGEIVDVPLDRQTASRHFDFTVADGQRIVVDLLDNVEPVDNYLRLVGPDGIIFEGQAWYLLDNHAKYLSQPGDYQIIAYREYNNEGRLSFRVTDLANAPSVVVGQPERITLQRSNELQAFQFTPKSDYRYSVTHFDEEGDTVSLQIRDPHGDIIHEGDGEFIARSNQGHWVWMDGTSGEDTIQFSRVTIELNELGAVDPIVGDRTLSLNTPTNIELAPLSSPLRYVLELTEPKQVIFAISSDFHNSISSQLIDSFGNQRGSVKSDEFVWLPAGRNVIEVSTDNTDASLLPTLEIRDIATAFEVSLGVPVLTEFDDADSPEKLYKIRLQQGDRFVIDGAGTSSDLYRSDGFRFDDDEDGSYVDEAVTASSDGYFYVRIHNFGGDSVHWTPGIIDQDAQELPLNQFVQGRIELESDVQRYQFTIDEPSLIYFDKATEESFGYRLFYESGVSFSDGIVTDFNWLGDNDLPIRLMAPGTYTLELSEFGRPIDFEFAIRPLSAASHLPYGEPATINLPNAGQSEIRQFHVNAGVPIRIDGLRNSETSLHIVDRLGRVLADTREVRESTSIELTPGNNEVLYAIFDTPRNATPMSDAVELKLTVVNNANGPRYIQPHIVTQQVGRDLFAGGALDFIGVVGWQYLDALETIAAEAPTADLADQILDSGDKVRIQMELYLSTLVKQAEAQDRIDEEKDRIAQEEKAKLAAAEIDRTEMKEDADREEKNVTDPLKAHKVYLDEVWRPRRLELRKKFLSDRIEQFEEKVAWWDDWRSKQEAKILKEFNNDIRELDNWVSEQLLRPLAKVSGLEEAYQSYTDWKDRQFDIIEERFTEWHGYWNEKLQEAKEQLQTADDYVDDLVTKAKEPLDRKIEQAEQAAIRVKTWVDTYIDEKKKAITQTAIDKVNALPKPAGFDPKVKENLIPVFNDIASDIAAVETLIQDPGQAGAVIEDRIDSVKERNPYGTVKQIQQDAKDAGQTANGVLDVVEEKTKPFVAKAKETGGKFSDASKDAGGKVSNWVKDAGKKIREKRDDALDQEIIAYKIETGFKTSLNLSNGSLYLDAQLGPGLGYDSRKLNDALEDDASIPDLQPVEFIKGVFGADLVVTDEYDQTRNALYQEFGAQNVFFATRRFVEYFGGETAAEVAVEIYLTGGEGVEDAIRDFGEHMRLEMNDLLAWIERKAEDQVEALGPMLLKSLILQQPVQSPHIELRWMPINYNYEIKEKPLTGELIKGITGGSKGSLAELVGRDGLDLDSPHLGFALIWQIPDGVEPEELGEAIDTDVAEFDFDFSGDPDSEDIFSGASIEGAVVDVVLKQLEEEGASEEVIDGLDALAGVIFGSGTFEQAFAQVMTKLMDEAIREMLPGEADPYVTFIQNELKKSDGDEFVLDLTNTPIGQKVVTFLDKISFGNQGKATLTKLTLNLSTFVLQMDGELCHKHSWGSIGDLAENVSDLFNG